MALRASELVSHFEHAIGAPLSVSSTLSHVNHAGGWICSASPWRFLERPPYRLNLRGTITITAATWTESTLTLTVTSPATAFSSYTLLEGDQVEITGGTGANPGFYDVMSNTASALVLRSSIGAAADTETDIAGELALPSARLPSDIQELVSVQMCGLSGSNVTLTTPSALVNIKADGTGSTGGDFYGAVVWGASVGTDGGAPVPRLELWPAPSVDNTFSVMVHYRAGWQRLTGDDSYSNTPDWFDSLLIQAVRAYAIGLDMESMDQQLAKVQTSAMFMDAQRRDSSIQRHRGRVHGGAVASRRGRGDPRVGPWRIELPS